MKRWLLLCLLIGLGLVSKAGGNDTLQSIMFSYNAPKTINLNLSRSDKSERFSNGIITTFVGLAFGVLSIREENNRVRYNMPDGVHGYNANRHKIYCWSMIGISTGITLTGTWMMISGRRR